MNKYLLQFLTKGSLLFLLQNEIKAEALNHVNASIASENEAFVTYSPIFK